MRRLLLTLISVFCIQAMLLAQTRHLSGTVMDPSGTGVASATIAVKGSKVATMTNADGKFTFAVPSGQIILEVSSVGYVSQSVNVAAADDDISVFLQLADNNLSEVVVTALGIKRDKKTLAYSSQQVSSDELRKTSDANFMNALNGKVAGINIETSSSGAGGSTKVLLRGNKSLSGLTSPLYVIDGIPMVNNKGGQPGMWGGTDQGDGLSQLNPDDIESVNVLKGANASILYGSQGANGVVIITTKKGKQGKATVGLNSSVMFDQVIDIPELQFRYGAINGSTQSWSTTKGNYNDKFVKDFFNTGVNLVNSVSISGGTDKYTTYFSYANTYAKGVVPNNNYLKHNIAFKQIAKITDKLTLTSNVMLVSEQTKNRPASGYYLNPLTGLYWFPRERDFSEYKNNYQVFNKDRNMYLQNWIVNDHMQSNPYWIINKQPKLDLTKRAIASLDASYDITSHLKFMARGMYDYAVKSYDERDFAGSNTTNVSANGRWVYSKFNDRLGYIDGIFKYTNNFGNLSLDALAGASYQQSVYGDGVSVNNGTNSLLYPNIFTFQNIPPNVMINSTYGGKRIKEGLFANVQLGFKEMIFLDLAGRNDWSSTLAGTGNQSYFYPAVGISAILSQMLKMPSYISFGKVRVSSSYTANDVPFNVVHPMNSIATAYGGINPNTQVPFTNLKPEMIRSNELGTEWRFFDNRLGFDFTYYSATSTNQFLTLSAPSGSGYTFYYVNAGKITNKGVELTIDATPMRSDDFTWKTSLNFARNVNKIVELIPDQPNYQIGLGSSDAYTSVIKAGGAIGDLWVYGFKKNDKGQILLNADSTPIKTSEQILMGNLNPKFSLGWNNNFTYKDLSLYFLITGNFGGKAFSQTESLLDGYGVSERSAAARDAGYVPVNGIIEATSTSVTQIKNVAKYYQKIGDRNGIGEAYVYDRTNVRLSQFALSYNFNMGKMNIPIKSATVSLIGRNLFFLYKKAPFDPENAISTDLNSQSLDTYMVPSTRSLGINLKLNF